MAPYLEKKGYLWLFQKCLSGKPTKDVVEMLNNLKKTTIILNNKLSNHKKKLVKKKKINAYIWKEMF